MLDRNARPRAAAHLLLGLGLALMLLLLAPAARAQGTPGSLSQLAPPNDCWQQTLDGTQECAANENGLTGTRDVVVSPDGQNVYVLAQGDDAIDEFSRNPTDGSLTPLGNGNNCIADGFTDGGTTCDNTSATGLESPQAIAISPDGDNVYVVAQDSNGVGTIAEFARNGDGSLTQLFPNDCIGENIQATESRSDCANQSGHGINRPFALAVSPDGQNVYVADQAGAVAAFTRHANGSLSQLNGSSDCIEGNEQGDCATEGPGLADVTGVAVSADGSNVYTGGTDNNLGGLIAEFTRNADGSLTQLPAPNNCIQEENDSQGCGTVGNGLVGITGLAISPDGRNVYSASEANLSPIAEFARNGDGSLTQLPAPNDCIQEQGDDIGCGTTARGIASGWRLIVSPDGTNVYAAAEQGNCSHGNCSDVAEFARNHDGSLTQLPRPDDCVQEGEVEGNECGSSGTGLGGPGLAISPDNGNVYVTGTDGIAELSRAPAQFTLTVTRSGSGTGSVTDDKGGISCPSDCQHAYAEGTQVTLTAKPASGSSFAGWSGGCSGTGTCTVTMNGDTNVTATFVQVHTLTVSRNGSGSGSVSDNTGSIACPPTCSHAYPTGSSVTLSASPASGSAFTGWSGGGCSGGGTCTIAMNSDTTVTATFAALPAPGPGSPSIKSFKPAVHGSHGAGFSGTVNPEGSLTHVFWQYGLDKRYTKAGGRGPDYTFATPRRLVGADASTHSESISVGELVPNALYHVRMVAYNGNGTAYGIDQTFITGKGGPPGSPVLGKSFDVAPVSGIVYIVIGHKLIPLTVNTKIPAGSIIDALHGSLSLTSASGKKGERYHGIFGGAVFRLTQGALGANRGLTTLALVEGTFKGAPTYASCKAKGASSGPRAAARIALSSRALQTLRSRSSGRFRTRGRYAAGTVRGTKWTTSDRCDGTLLAVQLHSVVVYDFVKRFFLLLPQGHSYLAGPHTPPPPESQELTEPHNEGGETTGP